MRRPLLIVGMLLLPVVASAQAETMPGAAAGAAPGAALPRTTPAPVPNIPPRSGAPADRVGNMRSGPTNGAPFSGSPSGTRGTGNVSPPNTSSADMPPLPK